MKGSITVCKNWFVLHSHPNKEDLLYHQLCAEGVGAYYPSLRVKPVNPRSRKTKPYFPGYLFVQVDLAETGMSFFQFMPFTTGLVCFGGEPAAVPEALIEAMRQKLTQVNSPEKTVEPDFQKGDRVLIHTGPFKNYITIFDHRISGSERVSVLLRMLNDNQIPLTLDQMSITKAQ